MSKKTTFHLITCLKKIERKKKTRVAILIICLSSFGILFGVFGVGFFFSNKFI